MLGGLFRKLAQPSRYFSYLNKVKEAQDQFGKFSNQALEAHMAYAWSLFSQKKHEEAKSNFSTVIEISQKVNGENTGESSQIIQRIAKSYESIGDLETSLKYYIQAYEIDAKNLSNDNEDILFAVNRIGAMHADLGDLEKAETYLGKIFEFVRKNKNSDLKSAYFGNLGHVKMRIGDKEKSLQYFLIAKEELEKVNPKDEMMVKYLQSIGMCYWVNGEYVKAKNEFFQALDLLKQGPGDNSLQIVDVYGHLAYLHNDMKVPEKMNEFFDKALEAFESSATEKKNEKIAEYLKNIAETLKSVGDLANAETYLNKLLTFCRKNFGETSRFTAHAYEQFSTLALSQQNFSEALAFAEKCLNSRKDLEKNHFDLVHSYNQFAAIYHTSGDLDSAEKYLQFVSGILSENPHKQLQTSHYHNLALLYRDKKVLPDAESNMKKHIEGVIAEYGESHPATAGAYGGLGHIYRVSQNYEKSLEAYHKALRICDETLGREHITTSDYLEFIGEVNRLKKNYTEALALHKESLNIKSKLLGTQHYALNVPYFNLAVAYFELKDFPNSELFALKRLEIFKIKYNENHSYVAGCYAFLSEIALASNDKDKALELLSKTREILIKVNNSQAVKGVDRKIAELQNR